MAFMNVPDQIDSKEPERSLDERVNAILKKRNGESAPMDTRPLDERLEDIRKKRNGEGEYALANSTSTDNGQTTVSETQPAVAETPKSFYSLGDDFYTNQENLYSTLKSAEETASPYLKEYDELLKSIEQVNTRYNVCYPSTEKMSAQYVANPTEENYAIYQASYDATNKILEEYNALVDRKTQMESEFGDIFNSYNSALTNYNAGVDQYNEWKSTVRDEDTIRKEMNSVFMDMNRLASRINTIDSAFQDETNPELALLGGSDSDKLKLAELQEKYRLLEEELDASTSFAKSDAIELNKGKTTEELETERKNIQSKRVAAKNAPYIKGYEDEIKSIDYALGDRYDTEYSELKNSDDYAVKSTYNSTEKEHGKIDDYTFADPKGVNLEDYFGDIKYDYINKNETAVNLLDRYEKEQSAKSLLGEESAFLKEMSDEEIANYNYLYNTDKAKAEKYLEYLSGELRSEYKETIRNKWGEYAKKNEVLSSIGSVVANPLKAISYAKMAGQMAFTGEMKSDDSANKYSWATSKIREEVANEIKDHYKKQGKTGETANFLYQTGMSMADFLYNTFVTGGFGIGNKTAQNLSLALMGTEVASDKAVELKDAGLSDDKAFSIATINGLVEILTEKVSLDTLLDKSNWLKNGTMKYLIKNFVAEGSEEGVSDILDTAADILMLKSESEWLDSIQEYQNQGMSYNEAYKQVAQDFTDELLLDVLGGAISGGVMGGASVIANNIELLSDGAKEKYIEWGKKTKKYNNNAIFSDARTLVEMTSNDSPLNQFAMNVVRDIKRGKQATDMEVGIVESALYTITLTDEHAARWRALNQAFSTDKTGNYTRAELDELIASAKDETERSAYEAGMSKQDYADFREFIKSTGLEERVSHWRFINESYKYNRDSMAYKGIVNGSYNSDTDTIIINLRSQNPITQVIAHEFTHHLENTNSEAYNRLKNHVLNIKKAIHKYDEEKNILKRTYADANINLSDTDVEFEMVAEYVEKELLVNKNAFKTLTKTNKSAADVIKTRIDSMLDNIRTYGKNDKVDQKTSDALQSTSEMMADAISIDKGTERKVSEKTKEKVSKIESETKEEATKNENHIKDLLEEKDAIYKDETLSEEEKDTKLDDIDAELKALGYDLDEEFRTKTSTSEMQGNSDGLVQDSDFVSEVVNDVNEKHSVSTEYNPYPKAIMSTSGGDPRIVSFIDGIEASIINGLKDGATINGFTGKDIRGLVMKQNGYTNRQIKNHEAFMEAMSDFMKDAGLKYTFIGINDINNARLRYTYDKQGRISSIVLSAMVNNGDYPVNFDLSTVCKKKEGMMVVIKELSKNGVIDSGTVELTRDELFKINKALRDAGYETACLGCFVEAKRYDLKKWAKEFCDKWNNHVLNINPNATYFGFSTDENMDKVMLKYADKFEDAATEFNRKTKIERLNAAISKIDENIENGDKPFRTKKMVVNDRMIETFSMAARNRLINSELIDQDTKERYLSSDVSEMTSADFKDLLLAGVLPGVAIGNNQTVKELVNSGEMYQHLLKPSDLINEKTMEELNKLPNFRGVLYGHYGSGTPKLIQGYTPYNSEIALLSNKKGKLTLSEYLYSIAGVRMQSFSDFKVENIYDYLQMVGDLAAKHLPCHAYTKEISFARLLGMTGIKVNLSVMFDIDRTVDDAHAGLTRFDPKVHKGEYAKIVLTDEQGDWVYNIGDAEMQRMYGDAYPENERRFVQSISFKEALMLQSSEGYSSNCGIIAVAYSDKHLLALLNDPRIRYIIPYHKSGLPGNIAEATYIRKATDYEPVQNNLKIKSIKETATGNKVSWTFKDATKRLGSAFAALDELNNHINNGEWAIETKLSQKFHGSYKLYENLSETQDPRETCKNYIEWCASNNTIPLHYKFANHENYYKVVYDFNMYDCLTEQYAPQTSVENTYPMQENGKTVKGDATSGSFNSDYFQYIVDDQMKYINDYYKQLKIGTGSLVKNISEKGEFVIDKEAWNTKPIKQASVSGENANLSELEKDNLEIAKKMFSNKEDMEKIRLATGWYRQSDKRWRYEFSDKDAFLTLDDSYFDPINRESERENRIKRLYEVQEKRNNLLMEGKFDEASAVSKELKRLIDEHSRQNTIDNNYRATVPDINTKLSSVLDFPKLYEYYPELSDMPVSFTSNGKNNGTYSPSEKAIKIDKGATKEATLTTLLHEVQHAIQDIEGYPKDKSRSYYDKRIEQEAYDVENRHNMTEKERLGTPPAKFSVSVDSDGNQLSEAQAEYFKDSKVRDENGSLIVMYHGTDSYFTVFDRTKSRSTMDIQGNFFSPWEIDAGGYGSNVSKFYLNIKNPAPESISYKALNMFKGQNDAGVKAREYLESLGYDGVNNNNEEIIAFYPEQIKSIDNMNPTDNKDIRFSISGENANLTIREKINLEKAKELDRDGKDINTIYSETGWYKQSDGKWRTNVDIGVYRFDPKGLLDVKKQKYESTIKENDRLFKEGKIELWQYEKLNELTEDMYGEKSELTSGKLSNFFRCEGLYRAYPKLQDVSLFFQDMDWNTGGFTDIGTNRIVLNSKYIGNRNNKDLLDSLVHEIQHIIQSYEGFEPGSDPSVVGFYDYYNSGGEIEARNAANRFNKTTSWKSEHIPVKFSFTGTNEYGVDVYETSAYIRSLSYEDRIKAFKELMLETLNGRTARLTTPDGIIYAKFDDISFDKNLHEGSKNKSSRNGRKAKINSGADGDLFRIVEKSKYSGENDEIGKHGKAHSNVKKWYYFNNTVQIDGRVYDVLTNVREKQDNEYLYQLRFTDNKKIAPSPVRGYVNHTHKDESQDNAFSSILENEYGSVNNYSINSENDDIQYSVSVDDPALVDRLESEPYYTTYKTMAQLPDGRLVSPMASEINGEYETYYEKGKWYESVPHEEIAWVRVKEDVPTYPEDLISTDTLKKTGRQYKNGKGMYSYYLLTEHPEMVVNEGHGDKGNVYFTLVKDNGETVPARYNPYEHSSNSMFNDQFKSAEKRGNLVTVEMRVPVSQDEQKVTLDYAKDSTGWTPWKSGTVSQELKNKKGIERKLFLSQYAKLERVIPNTEVAQYYKEAIDGTSISIPRETVTSDLRKELEKIGVPIQYSVSGETSELDALKEKNGKELTTDEATTLYHYLNKVRRNYEKVARKYPLDDASTRKLNAVIAGDIYLGDINPEQYDVEGIRLRYEGERDYRRVLKQLDDYKRSKRAYYKNIADPFAERAKYWKDKATGLQYYRETAERNIEDVIENREEAANVIRTFFKPVHTNESKRTTFIRDYSNRVKALNLSSKIEKGATISEAGAVQFIGEATDSIKFLENHPRIETRNGKTKEEWQELINQLWSENPNLDKTKIENAIKEFQAIYNELFDKANKVYVANGYAPIEYRQGYFPHFNDVVGDTFINALQRRLGVNMDVNELPVTIAGLTYQFKPGVAWFGNKMERKGNETSYDAVQGFQKYIRGISDVIYHTEDIQRLRAFATQIRYYGSDEAIQKEIDKIRSNTEISEDEMNKKIADMVEDSRFGASHFVQWIDEYTNILANKKSVLDRGTESMIGRSAFYNTMKWLDGNIGANLVGGNLSTAFTNFIPIAQLNAYATPDVIVKSMLDSLNSFKENDGFMEKSVFLNNRIGVDPLYLDPAQKFADAISIPMEVVDTFTSNVVVRSLYNQAIRNGMSDQDAMDYADDKAARIMAGRAKGDMPTLFAATNPIMRMFTKFQLEVNNQWSEVFHDFKMYKKDEGLGKLAIAMLRYWFASWLFNELYESVMGRRAAWDLLNTINELHGDITGKQLPNLIDLAMGRDGFDTKQENAINTFWNTSANILTDAPFSSATGTIGNMLGIDALADTGRVPIESAIPKVSKLFKDSFKNADAEDKAKTVVSEVVLPIAMAVWPYGGINQAQKTYKGVKALLDNGSYTTDANGNELLQYPIEGTNPVNWFRVMLFGKNSLPYARKWVDSDFDTMTKKETQQYEKLVRKGIDPYDAYDRVMLPK